MHENAAALLAEEPRGGVRYIKSTRLRVSCLTRRTSEHSSAGARGCDVRMFGCLPLDGPHRRRRSACRTADVLALKSHNLDATTFWSAPQISATLPSGIADSARHRRVRFVETPLRLPCADRSYRRWRWLWPEEGIWLLARGSVHLWKGGCHAVECDPARRDRQGDRGPRRRRIPWIDPSADSARVRRTHVPAHSRSCPAWSRKCPACAGMGMLMRGILHHRERITLTRRLPAPC